MTLATTLLPVTILLPLGISSALLALAHWLPSRMSTCIAILTSLSVAALCCWLAHQALEAPILHWYGGWTPDSAHRPGVVLGISFRADPASAAVAAFCAFLFTAAFVFAWSYFDEVHSHFEILMLLFLAAMVGFSLTHDLFNLFVWFELMSAAAFALTAYPLGKSSLEGAFNFTITNALASFMMLGGVGLLYARMGSLDFSRMGQIADHAPPDAALVAGFCLVAAALLTKAAIFPFHLWLADAHAVAPSPVSVIFSGAMVGLALFGLAKIVSDIFGHYQPVVFLVRNLLFWLGLATAIVGGAMAWAQRHLKRMLAFSTIAHLGIMLLALVSFSNIGIAGLFLYFFAHGLIKGTLFMIAGILLALCASVDEIVLYRKGRPLWAAGLVMGLSGMLLGGAPVGLLHSATELIESQLPGYANAAIIFAGALTGAAVLRACARIFFGWSGAPGPENAAPTQREHEKADRPLWLMLAPCIMLLVFVFVPFEYVKSFLGSAASAFRANGQPGTLPHFGTSLREVAPALLMSLLLAASLLRLRPTTPVGRALYAAEKTPIDALQFLHSGLVGDYVVWMMCGLAAFAIASVG